MFFAFYGVEPRESYINVISSQGELKDKIFFDKSAIYFVMFGDGNRLFINTGNSTFSTEIKSDSKYNWEKLM